MAMATRVLAALALGASGVQAQDSTVALSGYQCLSADDWIQGGGMTIPVPDCEQACSGFAYFERMDGGDGNCRCCDAGQSVDDGFTENADAVIYRNAAWWTAVPQDVSFTADGTGCSGANEICAGAEAPCYDALERADCEALCAADSTCVSFEWSSGGLCQMSTTCVADGGAPGDWTLYLISRPAASPAAPPPPPGSMVGPPAPPSPAWDWDLGPPERAPSTAPAQKIGGGAAFDRPLRLTKRQTVENVGGGMTCKKQPAGTGSRYICN